MYKIHHIRISYHTSCIHLWKFVPPWRWPRSVAETFRSINY